MDKLPMCRICLVENVNMCIVVNKNLQELYEKLTDIPFVTEDSRPILACFFCCTKLKQCFRFLRKCLEAEELFALMMNGDYEPNPSISQDDLHCHTGFIRSPTVHVSILDECETDSIAIKEEVPAIRERQDDVTEPKEEYQSDDFDVENLNNTCLLVGTEDIPPHPSVSVKIEVEEEQELTEKKQRAHLIGSDLKPVNLYDDYLDIEDIQLQSHHSESDFEEELPFLGFESEVAEEPEVSEKNRKAKKTNTFGDLKTVNLYDNYLDVEDVQRQSHHSELDLEDYVSLIKTEAEEEQELNINKRNAKKTNRSIIPESPVAKKPNLDTLRTKLEGKITPEIKKAAPEIIQITQKRTSTPFINTNTRIQNSNKNIPLDTNCRTNSDQDLKRFECDTCPSSFRYKSNLTKHIRKHTGEKPYKCDVCQRSFCTNESLKGHTRIHTGEKPYKCKICLSSFREKAVLTRHHIRVHTGEKPFKCDVCQRSFVTKSYLKIHNRIHTGEEPYKCKICPSSFREKYGLTKHIQMHAGGTPFKCDVCQRSFGTKSNLKTHIQIHTWEKPYKCKICLSSFRVKAALTRHIQIHTGVKSFKCHVCQCTFSTNGSLQAHTRIHTGEKPYKCKICPGSFRLKGDLTRHIRIHTGEKPYKCKICPGSFRVKGDLTRHIRRHTGEKPFKCDVCQRTFIRKESLIAHTREHTGEKPYKCKICPSSFNTNASLKIHIRTHTGENPGIALIKKGKTNLKT